MQDVSEQYIKISLNYLNTKEPIRQELRKNKIKDCFFTADIVVLSTILSITTFLILMYIDLVIDENLYFLTRITESFNAMLYYSIIFIPYVLIVIYNLLDKTPMYATPFNDIVIFNDNTLTRRWAMVNMEEISKNKYNYESIDISYNVDKPIKEIIQFNEVQLNDPKSRAINDACLTPIKSKKELKKFINTIAENQKQYEEDQKIAMYDEYYNIYKDKNIPLLETPYYKNVVKQGLKLKKEKEAIEIAANENLKKNVTILKNYN